MQRSYLRTQLWSCSPRWKWYNMIIPVTRMTSSLRTSIDITSEEGIQLSFGTLTLADVDIEALLL